MTSTAQRPGRAETRALIAQLRSERDRLADDIAHPARGNDPLQGLLTQTIEHLERLDDGRRQLTDERECILDALPAHIALIAADGTIVTVNEAWRRFAQENGFPGDAAAVGQNYLRTCDEAHGPGADEAAAAAAGIRAVLEGRIDRYRLE